MTKQAWQRTLHIVLFSLFASSVNAQARSSSFDPEMASRVRSPIGEPRKALAGERITVRVERATVFPAKSASVGMVRRRTTPTEIILQVLPTTTAMDLAHALVAITNSPGTTVRMEAPEMRAYFPPAGDRNLKAEREQLVRAKRLMATLNTQGIAIDNQVMLSIVSSAR